uniref:Uncharacterized protein n=1 Tax=Panagrolaimus davidi TaxID=227884 RepID=A0A914PGT1_9BILA
MALFRDTETQDYNIRMSDYYGHEITDNLPLDAICYQNINTQCNYNCSIPYFDFDLNEFDPLIEIEGDFVKENDHGIEIYGAGYLGSFL